MSDAKRNLRDILIPSCTVHPDYDKMGLVNEKGSTMTEEESGFTFVDRRKTSDNRSNPPTVSQSASPSDDTVTGNADFVSAGSMPTDPSPSVRNAADESDTSVHDAAEEFVPRQQEPDVYALLSYSLQLFTATAWRRLGLWADPATGETRADFEQARVAIDVVGDLVARLEFAEEEQLPERERREIRRVLNDLRMNYVARRQQSVSDQKE